MTTPPSGATPSGATPLSAPSPASPVGVVASGSPASVSASGQIAIAHVEASGCPGGLSELEKQAEPAKPAAARRPPQSRQRKDVIVRLGHDPRRTSSTHQKSLTAPRRGERHESERQGGEEERREKRLTGRREDGKILLVCTHSRDAAPAEASGLPALPVFL